MKSIENQTVVYEHKLTAEWMQQAMDIWLKSIIYGIGSYIVWMEMGMDIVIFSGFI